MNRRDFLEAAKNTILGAGAAVTLSGSGAIVGPLVWDASQNKWNQEELSERTEQCREEIRRLYGIKVGLSFKDFPPIDDIQGGKLHAREIQSPYLRYKGIEGIKYLLSLYPPELITAFLKEVRITDGLHVKGGMMDRSAGGTIDYEKKILVTNIQDVFQALQAMFNNVVPSNKVHHELGHLFTEKIPAGEWCALHPGVKYLGPFAIGVRKEDVPKGFVRAHSMSNEDEDQATVVEVMFSREDIYSKYKEDPIIAEKIAYLEKWYEKISGGRLNAQYWIDVRLGNVKSGYWDRG